MLLDTSKLAKEGIMFFDSPFSEKDIERWNKKLDPLFRDFDNTHRYNIPFDTLCDIGIVDEFFDNQDSKRLIRDITDDAVLLMFDVYEIKANQSESHIMGSKDNGWHRDIGEIPGLSGTAGNHFISFFMYLTDVEEQSGPFEIRTKNPAKPIREGDPSLKVTGKKGTTFIWNRQYYHRAGINTSSIRRRLLKVCFQHNRLPNIYMESGQFDKFLSKIDQKDSFKRFIFGDKHVSVIEAEKLPTDDYEAKIKNLSNSGIESEVNYKRMYFLLRRIINKIKSILKIKNPVGIKNPQGMSENM